MVSKILRRSGNAVVQYCELVEFEPVAVYLVGVGVHHQEVNVMRESWPSVALYGFEPNPQTYATVVEQFPGRLWQLGVGEVCGKATLYSRRNHKDGSSMHKNEAEQAVKTEVQVVTLDSMLLLLSTNFARRGLLWLDCEGSELAALRGGKDFIGSEIGVINVEMTSKKASETWPEPLAVHRWLLDRGFVRAWIHTTRVNVGQCDAIYVRRDVLKPEFCCCLCSMERQ